MKRKFFSSLLLVYSILVQTSLLAQIQFEKGYIIKGSSKKAECLIKNVEWRNNPTSFSYKYDNSNEIQTANIQGIQEFGIGNHTKYIRATVDIDRSGNSVNSGMSVTREPSVEKAVVFLKAIIEGEKSLYIYREANLTRFFLKNGEDDLEPLVYKKYMDGNVVKENEDFKRQLLLALQSKQVTINDVQYLRYSKKGIVALFQKYYESTNTEYKVYNTLSGVEFNLSIRPGVTSSRVSVSHATSELRNVDYNSEVSFRLGVEAEFVLPYQRKKWSLFTEPTYQYYNSHVITETTSISGGELNSTVEYSAITVPIGLRHYFHINDQSKFFVDAFGSFDMRMDSYSESLRSDGSSFNYIALEPKAFVALGYGLSAGYKFKDRYGVSVRYQTGSDLFFEYVAYNARYNAITLMLSYTLF